MATVLVQAKSRTLPLLLKFTDIRSYVIAAVFIALDVLVPRLFHMFQLAGATYLPMHIFVLLAGLLFGWRAGLIVGLFTPVASFAVSGMPVARILPQITVELATYGVVAGLLREKLNLRTVWSLLGAMVAGRIALLAMVFIISIITGTIFSPLGAASVPWLAVRDAVKQGLPGIIIQLALLPAIVLIVEKMTARKKTV